MDDQPYMVTASHLNLRRGAGIEASVVRLLARGDTVLRDSAVDEQVPGWWPVIVKPDGMKGFVARQYLTPQSGSAWRPEAIMNEILWDRTRRDEGKVAYLLGAKHSASGRIDCSGWVAELCTTAFDAVNSAARPEAIFHRADYRLLDTHSDGIISGIEGRTGFALHGAAVTPGALRPGMLIGCNFGDYGWEQGSPPRIYGIDHIVQVMQEPASDTLFITQSSHSGGGVNKHLLDSWYGDRVRGGMVAKGRLHAVDPCLLADRNTAYVRNSLASNGVVPLAAPALVAEAQPFGGRSFYIYTATGLVAELGSIRNAVDELKRCKADAIWVRIHGRGYVGEAKGASMAALDDLIAAARASDIAVAGWGWCQGDDPAADAALADAAIGRFGVTGYIADIEQDVNGAKWSQDEVGQFVGAFRAKHPDLPFAITSHGFIDWHSPELFDNVASKVTCMNPQTYWSEHSPSAKMLAAVKASAVQFPQADPASYALLCASRWAARYKRPVVIAGHICAEDDFTADEALEKLKVFFAHYRRPDTVLGEAFWHFGAASREIRDILAQN
jgi:hypothetical protein